MFGIVLALSVIAPAVVATDPPSAILAATAPALGWLWLIVPAALGIGIVIWGNQTGWRFFKKMAK